MWIYINMVKSVNSINSFLRYSKFWSPETRLDKPIFDHVQWKNFQFLIFLNLYQHAKNEAVSSICSDEIINLKIRNLIGWEYFGLYLRNKIFPKYRIYPRTQQIIILFTIKQIQQKLMIKFFFKLKKPYFWHISQFLWPKKSFQKIRLSCTTS